MAHSTRFNRRRWIVFFSFVAGLDLAAPAFAQDALDIVRLGDGSYVRGTIVERVEGVHVIIKTILGEVRTVPFSTITYAGRADDAASSERTTRVRFTSEAEGLTAHELAGTSQFSVRTYRTFGQVQSASYRPLCMAPCEMEVPRGTYRFGISVGDGDTQMADGGPFNLMDPATLDLEYKSRNGYRIAGWLLAGAALLVPVVTMAVVPNDTVSGAETVSATLVGSAVAGLLALPFILFNDHIAVTEVEPGGVRF